MNNLTDAQFSEWNTEIYGAEELIEEGKETEITISETVYLAGNKFSPQALEEGLNKEYMKVKLSGRYNDKSGSYIMVYVLKWGFPENLIDYENELIDNIVKLTN